jgi:putative colanic acid biosynthesis glycosyltransferase
MNKLVQINSVVNTGSTGRIAEEIGQVAINLGWKSYIAYGRKARDSKSELIRIGNDWDIKLHGVKTRLFDEHGFGSKNATEILIDKIVHINPDLIILHNLHGYYINLDVLFRYLANQQIPVLWILHDVWAFTGHCTHFDAVDCSKWITECQHCPQIHEYPRSLIRDNSKLNFTLKRQLFRSVKHLTLITCSKWLEELVKLSFLSKLPVFTINNGVNLDVFKPIDYQHVVHKYNLYNKFVILGVANGWVKKKGFDDFVDLRKRLNDRYVIILIGLNQRQINLLPKNIIGIERTENTEELAALYSVANVFLNPTYEDNFPTTNLEALACGTPVISYNTGGSPEAIDKETGVIVDKGNIDGIVKAIGEIEIKGKAYYIEKCQGRAVKYFNKDDRNLDYIKLYEEILKDMNG